MLSYYSTFEKPWGRLAKLCECNTFSFSCGGALSGSFDYWHGLRKAVVSMPIGAGCILFVGFSSNNNIL